MRSTESTGSAASETADSIDDGATAGETASVAESTASSTGFASVSGPESAAGETACFGADSR